LGCAIGDSGLLVLQEYGWIDLGFRFAQPHWGKGLATEVASVWVRAAFNDFHIDRLKQIRWEVGTRLIARNRHRNLKATCPITAALIGHFKEVDCLRTGRKTTNRGRYGCLSL
jgi:hypothetical protein